MPRLPSFRRIFRTDYPSQFQDLIEKLAVSLNNAFDVLFDAVGGKLSLKTNILCIVKDITLVVDANGKPTSNSGFAMDNPKMVSVTGIQVLKAVNNTNATVYPISQPFISFSITNNANNGTNTNTILMNNISGLQPGNSYTLTIIAYGE